MHDEICAWLVGERILREPVAPDAPLRAAGMDSLGFLQLFDWLEERWGVKVEESEMNPETVGTLDRLVALIERKGGAA